MKHLAKATAFLALVSFAGPALAADVDIGFWTGFVDGFLSLLKLLASPLVEVSLVTEDFGPWDYAIGYYIGAILFAGVAGVASFPADPVRVESRWA